MFPHLKKLISERLTKNHFENRVGGNPTEAPAILPPFWSMWQSLQAAVGFWALQSRSEAVFPKKHMGRGEMLDELLWSLNRTWETFFLKEESLLSQNENHRLKSAGSDGTCLVPQGVSYYSIFSGWLCSSHSRSRP